MSETNSSQDPNVHAENNSVAVGNLSIGGNVQGNITIGNTTGYSADEVSALLKDISSTFQAKAFDGTCPYKGLDYFEEEDAELFFGREKLVEDLVSRVKESRTVFITGPSGSGKSSLVRAGLIHALKQGSIKGSERWMFATMKPGRDPIGELGRVVASLAGTTNAEDEIRAKSLTDETILARWCEIVLKEGREKRLVLFIDQFEEVFTQISKEEERIAFLNLLTHAAEADNGRVILLFSMRSDFVPNCAVYPELNATLNRQFIQIGAMQPEELVSAIAQPALRVGLRIDPDLIAQIINDMKGEPGALPLMQFALKDLFDEGQSKGGMIALTLDAYLHHGGIQKSLERHADTAFGKLDSHEQELARSIFSGLIEVGRGTQDTKRTAIFDELIPANASTNEVETIVQKLADARLITTDESAGKDTVTISHEKLIDAWPWLKKLVNENRDVIALQNEIAEDAKEWEARKRDVSYLYTGGRLANVREQVEKQNLALNHLAKEFVRAGRARQRRGQVLLVSAISIVLIAAIVASVIFQNQAQVNIEIANAAQAASTYAIEQQGIAQANAEEALKQANIARSQILTINANSNPLAVQKNILLSIEAINLVKDYSFSDRNLAEQSIHDTLANAGGIPLSGHEESIYTLAFSPDGQWLATGSFDTTARLWKVDDPSADPIVLRGHENTISTLAFSPDGQWLATGSADNTARLWKMDDPSADPIVLRGHENLIRTLAFSPDGKWLATGSDDNTARLWKMDDPSADPIVLKGHKNYIYTLAFSPDGQWLATGSDDNTARLWKVDDPSAQPIVLKGHGDYILTLAFSPDGNWLATGSVDNTTRLWKVDDPSADPIVLKGHENLIRTLAFSPDGQWLATGSFDNTARLWDMRDPSAAPIVLKGHENSINTLAFSPDGQWLATGSDDNTARLWKMDDPSADPIVLKGHENLIRTLAFSPDGNWLATGSDDNTTRLWKMDDPSADPIVLKGHEESIYTLAFSPDGQWLATGSGDNTTRLWKVDDPSADPIVLKGHENLIRTLAFSPDGQWLATGSVDNTARLWKMDDPSADPIVLKVHENLIFILTLAFSPDGKWLATRSVDNTARLWKVDDPSADPIVLKGHEKSIYTLAFSLDGKWLATGSYDNTARLWKMDDPSADPIVLKGHEKSIYTLAFSPDGGWLATGSYDNTARLWKVDDPSADPIVLKGHGDYISTLAFNPDGNWLATGSVDNTARLWNVKIDYLLKKACSVVGRNFTRVEWGDYFPNQEYRKTCEQWPLEPEITPTETP